MTEVSAATGAQHQRFADWRVLALRMTAFPVTPFDRDKVVGWEEAIGSPPDQMKEQPQLRIREETGEHKGGQLTLGILPDRIEWRYGAPLGIPSSSGGVVAPADLPRYSDAVNWFIPFICEQLPRLPPLTRVAFGPELLLPAEDHDAAYGALGSFLSSVKVDPTSREFEYAINRRRTSTTGIPGLEINRLSRWSSLEFHFRIFSRENRELGEAPSSFATRLVMDINTAHEYTQALPTESLLELFEELARLATEIAEKGEVP